MKRTETGNKFEKTFLMRSETISRLCLAILFFAVCAPVLSFMLIKYPSVETFEVSIKPFLENDGKKKMLTYKGYGLLRKQNGLNIKPGTDVYIKAYKYPFAQYGVLKGHISLLIADTTSKGYVVEIALPGGLETSFKKNIPQSEVIYGMGDIISENKSLLRTLYDRVK